MRLKKKYFSKLFFKQWTVGVSEQKIEDIIRHKKETMEFTWLESESIMQSFADPCAFIDDHNNLVLLAEDFTTGRLDGKITKITYSKNNGFSKPETVLNTGSHFSYPMLHEEADKMYMIAENALDGGLHVHEYDKTRHRLFNKQKLSDLPLIDATVLKQNGRYWIFSSLLGKGVFNELHIFYADNFWGPYTAHANNPVKRDYNGSRPAGKFIIVDGVTYRPAQNNADYYGESITIQKITKLSEDEFAEEEYMKIRPGKNSEYNLGIHTINAAGDYIVADGQRGHLQPLLQLKRHISKFFQPQKNGAISFLPGYAESICIALLNFEGWAIFSV